MLPPSERSTYQIHMPGRSKGVSPAAGGGATCSAPPGAAEAMRVSAVSAITNRIARSTRRSPDAGVLLVLTSTPNTVARAAWRHQSYIAHRGTEFGCGCLTRG